MQIIVYSVQFFIIGRVLVLSLAFGVIYEFHQDAQHGFTQKVATIVCAVERRHRINDLRKYISFAMLLENLKSS